MSIYGEVKKSKLLDEIYLKNRILVEGLSFEPGIFKNLDLGNRFIEQVNVLFAVDKHAHNSVEFPGCFLTPLGNYRTQIRWNQQSPLSLVYEDGQFNIRDQGKPVIEKVKFAKRPDYYRRKTSDGTDMRTVATDNGNGAMFVSYSNECSLKEKGLDCRFCNINATKSIYGDSQNIKWKTPQQVGETIAAGYNEGFDHVTISGGFISERREVEYYIDVAEAIQEHTGLQDFNGTGVIGAPLDLDVFEKYKEAGYRTMATNIELWNEKMFDVICPGKAQLCGGRQNWLNALDEEVRVFGKYKVRSTMVAGIEPKESLLEGVEYLIERGVIAQPSQWNVNVGSPLEGHRTPNQDWHWDVFEKTVTLYIKHGITWDELRDSNAGTDAVPFDLYRLEQGIELNEAEKLKYTA
ncbi:radical SAM protein [Leadbettera azotonutricia]|uniref:Radical SAM domain protein n=1 Tax=Leadbettera azotonutricia (strain ATCC BAA-888 / DSM 13862 / ZAS-9) TaxID=545695 RepID=F5YCM8_LEAAZ|nr:radical SAM protein [Leadbettera azotonutricia]AEF82098.1 radical SAM domain protein [Leadbettera azotonutricia ZAS-9]